LLQLLINKVCHKKILFCPLIASVLLDFQINDKMKVTISEVSNASFGPFFTTPLEILNGYERYYGSRDDSNLT
jgi:hypothetical protein